MNLSKLIAFQKIVDVVFVDDLLFKLITLTSTGAFYHFNHFSKVFSFTCLKCCYCFLCHGK